MSESARSMPVRLWWKHLQISVRLLTVLIQTSILKKLSALAIKDAVLAGIISYMTLAADVK